MEYDTELDGFGGAARLRRLATRDGRLLSTGDPPAHAVHVELPTPRNSEFFRSCLPTRTDRATPEPTLRHQG